jgi:transcription initiation factor TFIID subunit 2
MSLIDFGFQVDPVKLNIPHYFDVVPRENARDLSLIKAKLNANRYETVEDFEADVNLMVRPELLFYICFYCADVVCDSM